ncbi:hypothetical protein Q8F83_25905, partial [Klebsiella pneumoniae]|nr:hypothetical protein [Klebsiella pneumoniae]
SKAYAFALAGPLPFWKHQLALTLFPFSLSPPPSSFCWLMDSLLAAGLLPYPLLIAVPEPSPFSSPPLPLPPTSHF